MLTKRLPIRDPRTVARDIPGVIDILFPRLSGGLVASLNRKIVRHVDIDPVEDELVAQSDLQHATLFEIAVVRAELKLGGNPEPSWDECLGVAAQRMRAHYDSKIPQQLAPIDIQIATEVSENLLIMLHFFVQQTPGAHCVSRPEVPGLGWIASGEADFALGTTLIEVKNTDRNFIAADYRQILIYWLMKYAAAVEHDTEVWSRYALVNPRRNLLLIGSFDALAKAASGGASRLDLLSQFRSVIVGDADGRK